MSFQDAKIAGVKVLGEQVSKGVGVFLGEHIACPLTNLTMNLHPQGFGHRACSNSGNHDESS